MVRTEDLPEGRFRLGRSGLLCLLPGLLAAGGAAVAQVLPEQSVYGQIAMSSLLSAVPWLMGLWVPWSLAAAVLSRRWVLPLVCGLLGIFGVGRPLSWVVEAGPAPPGAWTLLVANVNSFPPEGTDTAVLADQLAAVGAQVVVVIERRPEALPGYVRVADNFDAPMERISHASAVFCREGLACEAEVTEEFGSPSMTMPLALVDLGGAACLMGLHGPPPVPYDPTGLAPHVDRIARAFEDGRLMADWGPCAAGQQALVVGDLNQVPGSRAWRALVRRGLVDALAGVGVFGVSWPAGGGWPDAPFFRLDHVLHGPELRVGGVEQHRLDGADHLAQSLWVAPR